MNRSLRQRAGAPLTLDTVLRLVIAAGLGIDAYVHARLAGDFDAVTATISQGALFRIEAGVAALLALLALVLPWRRAVYAPAAVAAGSALGAVLLYRYVNVGPLGPLPNMYEPVWYFDKTLAGIAEAAALAAAMTGLASTAARRPHGASSAPNPRQEVSD